MFLPSRESQSCVHTCTIMHNRLLLHDAGKKRQVYIMSHPGQDSSPELWSGTPYTKQGADLQISAQQLVSAQVCVSQTTGTQNPEADGNAGSLASQYLCSVMHD